MTLHRRLFLASVLLAGTAPALHAAEPVPVVASFSIIADLVRQVGGERIAVSSIVGPDTDAHVYEPTPADAKRVASAKVVIINGLGFESWADRLVKAANYKGLRVVATKGLKVLAEGKGYDPHAWQDVANVKGYVANIRDALIEADAAGADSYKANAAAYLAKLDALDGEIRAALSAVPRDKRKVITSHDAFTYFGDAYDVDFIAPQGKNTSSEASARQVSALIRQIKAENVKAVFVENMANSKVIEQISRETGVKIGGKLYADALGKDVPTYIDMMRWNVKAIAEALKQ